MQKTEVPEDKKIKLISMHDEMSSSYLSYAMSVIVSRALPDIRDGLKPVHRRILYAMYKGGYDWSKQFRKSARIVGDVIGKYHPHGDQSVYDALVRMVQDFSMSLPLVDGQGNFGSIDGDPAAAMRYTETRLSKVSQFLIDDKKGVTAKFNKNILRRINTELGADINLNSYKHLAIYNKQKKRIEMRLKSKKKNNIRINGSNYLIKKNEEIHTENSHKYTIKSFKNLANKAGWKLDKTWVDGKKLNKRKNN